MCFSPEADFTASGSWMTLAAVLSRRVRLSRGFSGVGFEFSAGGLVGEGFAARSPSSGTGASAASGVVWTSSATTSAMPDSAASTA
jgi:hypothetical protein